MEPGLYQNHVLTYNSALGFLNRLACHSHLWTGNCKKVIRAHLNISEFLVFRTNMTESKTSKSKKVPKFLLVLGLIKFVHFQAQTDPFAWQFIEDRRVDMMGNIMQKYKWGYKIEGKTVGVVTTWAI